MNHVITSFGKGSWYPKGIERLKNSCSQWNVICQPFLNYPYHCPTHQQTPYAFKPYCIEAVKKYHDIVIWCDSSGWLMNDPQPIFETIEKQGYILFDSGWHNDQWCSDRQLEAFGFSRDQAAGQKHVVGGLFGLDFRSEIGQMIWSIYRNSIDLFKGDWNNDHLTESADPRCLGSRHDQSILSLIAATLDLTITNPAGYFTFDPKQKDCIFALQGM